MTENKNKLPNDFADLQDLADKFAISDDVERDAVQNSASDKAKRALVSRLSPRLSAINAYIDDHDGESAHLLGRLAEAACEVAIEVGWPEQESGAR